MTQNKGLVAALEIINSLIQEGRYSTARQQLGSLNKKFPNNFDILCLIAGIEATTGNFQLAIDFYSKAHTLTKIPEALIDVYLNLARCLEIISDHEQAAKFYLVALELKPTAPSLWFGLAQNYLVLGSKKKAYNAYKNVISYSDISSDSQIRSKSFYAISQASEISAEHLATLERDIEICSEPNAKSRLYFSIAYIHENNKDYQQAFNYFRLGNDTMLDCIQPYHHAKVKFHANHLIELFNNVFVQRVQETAEKAAQASERPIFIVGLPRSGSTLVESLLASNENVIALGEVEQMSNVVNKAAMLSPSVAYPDSIAHFNLEQLESLRSEYQKVYGDSTQSKQVRYVDKFLANFWNIGLIKSLFPKAKIVACEKSLMDTCLSLYRQHFDQGHPYSYSLSDCENYFKVYLRLIEHWERVYPDSIFRLKYESLVERPEQVCVELFKYCEIEWSELYLSNFVNRRYVKTASAMQVRSGINRVGVERWKNYREQLERYISK